MGGEFGGEWIHVYVWLSPFSFHLKLSQLCQSALLQYKIAKKKKKKDLKSMTHSFSFKCLRKRLPPHWSVFQILSDTMYINVQFLYPGWQRTDSTSRWALSNPCCPRALRPRLQPMGEKSCPGWCPGELPHKDQVTGSWGDGI